MSFPCYVIVGTVNALLLPAGTIFFEGLHLRVLIKRGYYSRAATIRNVLKISFQTSSNLTKTTLFFSKDIAKLREMRVVFKSGYY